jgi:hypothetical protein
MRIGHFLSSEEFDPRELITQARMAENAGFAGLWISDHFHPCYRDAAGGRRLVAGRMKVCWAEDEHQARATAYRLWPNEQLPGELAQILPTPAHFEQASELISEDMVAEAVPCGPDVDLHLQAIKRYEDAGFDELYIQQIGSDHERFFETYASEILPRFHDHKQAAALSSAAA